VIRTVWKTILRPFHRSNHDIIGKVFAIADQKIAMQGRDARGQSASRGRGRNGRGGRGMEKRPPRTGTVAAIGAYLDLVPGREVNPGVVTNWINKMGEYVMTVCDSKINLIFGPDGTLGYYPEIVEPLDPAANCTKVETKKWELAYSKYSKDVDKLEQDKVKVCGLMLGQISQASKDRIKETEAGEEAVETQDPRTLLSAILSTHMTDNRLGAEHNLFKINQAFSRYRMEPGDSLGFYYQRFRALLGALEEGYNRADEVMPEGEFRDVQLGLKFTEGLNNSYSVYKQYHEDGIKAWPQTLSDAFAEASKFAVRRGHVGNPSDVGRANAFAMRGRGRGRGAGRYSGRGRGRDSRGGSSGQYTGSTSGGPSEYGTRKGACHTCGESGHYSFECKASENGNNAKAGASTVLSDSSGHGKGK
jgi:Zinc knuckle